MPVKSTAKLFAGTPELDIVGENLADHLPQPGSNELTRLGSSTYTEARNEAKTRPEVEKIAGMRKLAESTVSTKGERCSL